MKNTTVIIADCMISKFILKQAYAININTQGVDIMQRGKGSSLHDLVSSFDDLPAMMSKMNASSSSSGNDLRKDQRYPVAGNGRVNWQYH